MTKLERKLVSLGYEESLPLFNDDNCVCIAYTKREYGNTEYILLNHKNKRLNSYHVIDRTIKSQKNIDDLQIAFNNVRRDFEELKNETTRNDTKRTR